MVAEIDTPVFIRTSFNGLIDVFKNSWGDNQLNAAKSIVGAMKKHPYLRDQIPYDIEGMARSLAAGKGLGF